MYKAVVVQVYSHVGNTPPGIKKNQVAFFQFFIRHPGSDTFLIPGGAGKGEAKYRQHQTLNKCGTINSFFGGSPKTIRCFPPIINKIVEIAVIQQLYRYIKLERIFKLVDTERFQGTRKFGNTFGKILHSRFT